MTLRVSGKNLDIGEALRQHVLEKVEATVARYFAGSVGGHVVITREGSGYRSDCTLRLSSGVSLHAEGRAHEPYPCFEQAADKIESRLRRYKTRLKGHAGPPAAGGARSPTSSTTISWSRRGKRKNPPGASIRSSWRREPKSSNPFRSPPPSPSSICRAPPVVVFQHAGSGRVNVVYRRRDGAIGWLDPQALREPRGAA